MAASMNDPDETGAQQMASSGDSSGWSMPEVRSNSLNASRPGTAPAAVAAPVPRQIGRYRVEQILGQGGFGIVYLAHDEQLNRPVAIKVPHSQLVADPSNLEAYLAEARTVANLD